MSEQEQQQSSELFVHLDNVLRIIPLDFFKDPREFRSLIKVLEVLNDRVNAEVDQSSIDVSELQKKLELVNKVVEEVVTFQHGGLNNSLDTMSEVVKEYSRGQEEIKSLRNALEETQKVLTAKKSGQTSLRDLWTRKVELQESLKLVKELEDLKNVPSKVTRLIQQKRYFSSVMTLNKSIEKIFSEDLSNIGGITPILQQIMELKERLLTETIDALKDSVLGVETIEYFAVTEMDAEDDGISDTRSESALSHLNGSTVYDDKSVISFNKGPGGDLSDSVDGQWATDLHSFDETMEAAAIMDSNSSNNLFIRLLVKTIGALNCEDDAERLLIDRFSNRFCEHYLKEKRTHIKKQLDQLGLNPNGDDNDILLHGKMLGRYISFLLDGVIGIVRRFSYVINLFSISKSSRGVDCADSGLNEVLNIWNEMEDMVNYELRIHMVESDVEQISDHAQALEIQSRIILDEDGVSSQGDRTLFRPSSRHAAILFRRIVEYNNTSNTVLQEFFGSPHVGKDRPLLQYMQHFLESEFIPLIQSSVNQDIREMAINVESNFQQRKAVNSERDAVPCQGAYRTALVAESLLVYYQELFQHREMVMVVLDRLIRGFLSAGRDYMETTLFSWTFLNGLQMKVVMNSVRSDPLFSIFKQSYYNGKQTLEEAFGVLSSERNIQVNDVALVNVFVNELTLIWDERIWDVSAPQYLKNVNLGLTNELHVVETLSTILYGVEWLTRKLTSLVRRTSAVIHNKSSKDSVTKSSSKFPIAREDNLRSGLLPPLYDLMKFVDEIVSVLRLACQVHCFVFTHELTQVAINLEYSRFSSRKEAGDFSILLSDEAIIAGFIQRLGSVVDIISTLYSAAVVPSVIGPVSVLVPRLLLNFILRLGKVSELSPHITTKLLRLVVAIQQHLSMFFQTVLCNDLEAKRKLIDCLTEESERLRRYITKADIQ